MPDKNNSLKAALEGLKKIDTSKWPKVSSAAVEKIAEALKPSEQLQRFAENLRRQQPEPQPEPPKRKHKPHKPHRQYQRVRVRAVLDQMPNWHELSDGDLVEAVQEALPKGPKNSDPKPPDRKTILREAGRLK
jgi:hypothetical protein